MSNVNKYWNILELLNFPIIGGTTDFVLDEEQRLIENLKILKNGLKITPEDIIKTVLEDENLSYANCTQNKIIENADDRFLYCLYSIKMIFEICKSANFSNDAKEDLVSEQHKVLIISSLLDVASFALQDNLHPSFYLYHSSIFKKRPKRERNFSRLEFMVEIYSSLIFYKISHIRKSLDDVHLWYMASIFSLLIYYDARGAGLKQLNISNLQTKLQKLWLNFSKKMYYRNLLLLFPSLSMPQNQRIHREMLMRLWSPGGFTALLFAMADLQRSENKPLDEIIANIVGEPSFSIKVQHSLIKQILEFLKASLKNKDMAELMGPGLLSLRRLCNNNEKNKEYIQNWIEKEMEPLLKVEKCEMIAMEWLNFVELISLMFHIFCTSDIASLASELIAPFLPVILEIYSQVEGHTNQKRLCNHLYSLILKILNNRSKEELKQVIEYAALKCRPKSWFQLSSNIKIKENPLNMQELKLTIIDSQSITHNKNLLPTLVAILKNSSYNLLVYQHFLILLQLVPSIIMDTNSLERNNLNLDLLETEEDIFNKMLLDIPRIYENKFEIIKALESFVHHKPLKNLINDNIKDVLKVLQDILSAYSIIMNNDSYQTDINLAVLMILLILIREILEKCAMNVDDLQKNLLTPIKHLGSQVQNKNIQYQISCILNILQGYDLYKSREKNEQTNDFDEARSLIESNESYLQVEGIEKMIKLLNKRDVYTLANGHMLTALALNTLKSPESYTFLNCVRLFVALVNVNECEVLELLSDEYLNEAVNLDYRLVIGEVILKTTNDLGPLCYKYKNVLLNTFMVGCRSPLNEFRFSAFSNLSQLCRQLTYQVHNYFEELLNLIDYELTTGKYLPAKRAAVMVLSDLLNGMDNLFDYQEMLLPIYRLLKFLVGSEKCDEKIRIHASNGLTTLSDKCKELFKQYQCATLEKEIKIMNINQNNPVKNLKNYILEIN